jgi:hypothetical protein
MKWIKKSLNFEVYNSSLGIFWPRLRIYDPSLSSVMWQSAGAYLTCKDVLKNSLLVTILGNKWWLQRSKQTTCLPWPDSGLLATWMYTRTLFLNRGLLLSLNRWLTGLQRLQYPCTFTARALRIDHRILLRNFKSHLLIIVPTCRLLVFYVKRRFHKYTTFN